MTDTDKLKEAIRHFDAFDSTMDASNAFEAILTAARAHLAELEAKRPKRATIRDMILALNAHDGCLASIKSEREAFHGAADILRALDEVVVPWLKSSAWEVAWRKGSVSCIDGLTPLDVLRALGESP